MSKKSRGFRPGGQPPSSSAGPGSSGSGPSGSDPGRHSTSSTPTSRSAARRSGRATPPKPAQTGLAKYRTVLVVGAVIIGIGILAIAFYSGATAARYECEALLTPAPEPSTSSAVGPVASAAPTPLLGFATRDLGRTHVQANSTVTYAFCPPASGEHWSIGGGRAPLNRQFYRAGDDVTPGNWVHNLEHGWVVIAYRDELTDEQEAGIQEVFETANQGPLAQQCGLENKVLAAPFADMDQPFALIAWDRVLLMPEWDTESALAFANQWQESPQMPEPACP